MAPRSDNARRGDDERGRRKTAARSPEVRRRLAAVNRVGHWRSRVARGPGVGHTTTRPLLMRATRAVGGGENPTLRAESVIGSVAGPGRPAKSRVDGARRAPKRDQHPRRRGSTHPLSGPRAGPVSRSQIEAEMAHRLVLVVRTAPELEIVCIHRAAFRERHHVMELEKARLAAAPSCPNESTSAGVPRPDRAFHRRRHVAASRASR